MDWTSFYVIHDVVCDFPTRFNILHNLNEEKGEVKDHLPPPF